MHSTCPSKDPVLASGDSQHKSTKLTIGLADQRKYLRVEYSHHRPQPGLHVLWRLFQGQDDVSTELSSQPARYTTTSMQGPHHTVANGNTDFKFIRPLYHPNIYPDGRLCISILHPPGDDAMSGETAAERWSPVQRVETVLISILSLLDDAEVSSPANVDAGVMLRNNPVEYREMVSRDLELSKKDIPTGFVMPTHETAWRKKEEEGDFDMSWEDSDIESFGGSDSDADSDHAMDSDSEGGDEDAEATDQDDN